MSRRRAIPPVTEYKRRRRERETVNELVTAGIVSMLAGVILTLETVWVAVAASRALPHATELNVAVPVRIVTAVILAANLGILILVSVSRARWYGWWRKYLIVAVRMGLLGALTWAQWYNPRPDIGLLLPIGGFGGAIVLAALSYSRRAVLLAGALAIGVYGGVSLLGPDRPENLKAIAFATMLFLAVTAVTYRLVSSMLLMSVEAVSNERLSRFFSPEIVARIASEPELTVRGTACHVSVLFSDISGFTAMSGRMSPEEVVNLLKRLLSPDGGDRVPARRHAREVHRRCPARGLGGAGRAA